MDEWVLAATIVAAAIIIVGAILLLRGRSGSASDAVTELSRRLQEMTAAHADLGGRLAQFGETSATSQEALTRLLNERLDLVTETVGQNLKKSATTTAETLGELKNRLKVIDKAQTSIKELSDQVVSLQDILSNKQARGAFGEVQLENLVRNALPPSAYKFQAQLGNGKRADCLLTLPNPPGAIVIDAKFPLEGYRMMQVATDEAAMVQAKRAFAQSIEKHVKDIAERYIINGETAESALMFLPSEAIYAELHANFGDTVDKSYRARVWIVSPTTLMATLHTIRAVLKDAAMREQAHVIQEEVMTLLEDVTRLGDRVDKLGTHFDQAARDIGDIKISTGKIKGRGERIGDIQLETKEPDAEQIMPPNAGREAEL